MKALAIATLLGLTLLSTACTGPTRLKNDIGATPAYSSRERFTMIGRNWDYEGKQLMDDIDHALLLRPASRNSLWNVHEDY
ncbi:MAG: hypothetical protein IT447_07140 [Phycisphaerales bacterium]|jgi:hypothetical protein|nr:hypothetical protein [Phycisphaerales bacterium]